MNKLLPSAIISCLMASAPTLAESVEKKQEIKANKPNVLILMFDDMRFDSFSYRGGPVPTPNIDALAAQSTRFDMAMSTTGLCSPSRAAFYTGRWGHRTGLDDNVSLYHSRQYELSLAEGGLIRRAATAGYLVGHVGKWHIGAQGPQLRGAEFVRDDGHGEVRNVRHYVPHDRQASIDRYNRGELDANGEKHAYYETLEGTYEDTQAALKVRQGQEMLRLAAKEKRPFFGVVSFNQPHPQYRVPEPYASMFDPKEVEKPANHLAKRVNKPMAQDEVLWPWHDVSHMTDDDWQKSRAFYYGAVAMVDRAVGEIIETAREVGLYDDLHIVFVGDQGSMIGEHNLYDKGPYAYDELMRIPLLIRNPNIKSRRINRHVSLIDVAPTLAEWMDLPPDGAVDGRSLTPLMKSGDKAVPKEEDHAIYAYEWYNGAWYGIRAIRTQDLKFVWNPAENKDELYDLRKDPTEINNVIGDPRYANKLEGMTKKLEGELARIEDPALKVFRKHFPSQ